MKDVVPHFFSFSKYASFTRQITGWNFSRKGAGPDRGSYYHELFLRGRPHLVKFMKREVAGQMKTKSPSVNHSGRMGDSSWSEPDLFELSKACPLPDTTGGSAKRSAVVSTCTAGAGESQHQFVRQPGANSHCHTSADSGANIMHPSSGYNYAYHHDGYQQWEAPGASYSNHYMYPPPNHYYMYAQPSQVRGQERRQYLYSEQERYSEHRLYEQHRSSFLFNAPPLSHSDSHDNPNGTHYFGQQQGHHDQNALYSTRAAHPPWQSYHDREQHLNHQQQQQQHHRENGDNHAWGTTNEIHDGSTDDHEYSAEQQALLKDGNREAGPGPSGEQNGSGVSHLPLHFQPPTSARTKDVPINDDHLLSLDEEQRAALLGILGTAVDGKSPSTNVAMEKNSKDKDADGDSNSADNDDEKGNTDASEDGADIEVSPIKFSSH